MKKIQVFFCTLVLFTSSCVHIEYEPYSNFINCSSHNYLMIYKWIQTSSKKDSKAKKEETIIFFDFMYPNCDTTDILSLHDFHSEVEITLVNYDSFVKNFTCSKDSILYYVRTKSDYKKFPQKTFNFQKSSLNLDSNYEYCLIIDENSQIKIQKDEPLRPIVAPFTPLHIYYILKEIFSSES